MTILIGSSLRSVPESLDFHVHARRQIQLHQRVHRVRRGLQNVNQPLVRAHFKLLARFLVHVRRSQHRPAVDRRGQRNRPGHFRSGALGGLHNFPRGLVQDPVIVGLQSNANFVALSHLVFQTYSMISVTAPAPTVWPPSRIAKRKPFSRATGVIMLTSQLTLSPGMTISTPCGSFTSPVTSVVPK